MGITTGTLIKRGSRWYWKFRADGKSRYEKLNLPPNAPKKDAERLRQARQADFNKDNHGFLNPPENPTVEKFWQQYEEWARSHKRPATLKVEAYAWKTLIQCCGHGRVGSIKRQDIEQLKSALKERGTVGEPLSEASINKVLRELKSIFNSGIKEGFFTGANPVMGIRMYRLTETMPTFLTKEQAESLLRAAKDFNKEIHCFVALAVYAGLRLAEISFARWEWFDWKHKLITVRRGHGLELKDHAERQIPLAAKLAGIIEPHAKEEGFIFDGGPVAEHKHYRYEPRDALKKIAAIAGVPANFQILRRTFGSLLVQEGVSIFKVSKWLGHCSVTVTEKHYAGIGGYDAEIDRI